MNPRCHLEHYVHYLSEDKAQNTLVENLLHLIMVEAFKNKLEVLVKIKYQSLYVDYLLKNPQSNTIEKGKTIVQEMPDKERNLLTELDDEEHFMKTLLIRGLLRRLYRADQRLLNLRLSQSRAREWCTI